MSNLMHIPKGKNAVLVFATDAGNTQEVTIRDPQGNVVYSHSGSGYGKPTLQDTKVLENLAGGNYKVTIQANGKDQKVIMNDMFLSKNGQVCAQTYTFVTEDSTDHDFNDTYLNLTWFRNEG